ncbi:unnamed protein product [Closterium sp. Naga37s-1]|nr:unnamed protein product [Closterium sp. Naga37s-1]
MSAAEEENIAESGDDLLDDDLPEGLLDDLASSPDHPAAKKPCMDPGAGPASFNSPSTSSDSALVQPAPSPVLLAAAATPTLTQQGHAPSLAATAAAPNAPVLRAAAYATAASGANPAPALPASLFASSAPGGPPRNLRRARTSAATPMLLPLCRRVVVTLLLPEAVLESHRTEILAGINAQLCGFMFDSGIIPPFEHTVGDSLRVARHVYGRLLFSWPSQEDAAVFRKLFPLMLKISNSRPVMLKVFVDRYEAFTAAKAAGAPTLSIRNVPLEIDPEEIRAFLLGSTEEDGSHWLADLTDFHRASDPYENTFFTHLAGLPVATPDDPNFERIPSEFLLEENKPTMLLNFSCHVCTLCGNNHRAPDHETFAARRRGRLTNKNTISIAQLQQANGTKSSPLVLTAKILPPCCHCTPLACLRCLLMCSSAAPHPLTTPPSVYPLPIAQPSCSHPTPALPPRCPSLPKSPRPPLPCYPPPARPSGPLPPPLSFCPYPLPSFPPFSLLSLCQLPPLTLSSPLSPTPPLQPPTLRPPMLWGSHSTPFPPHATPPSLLFPTHAGKPPPKDAQPLSPLYPPLPPLQSGLRPPSRIPHLPTPPTQSPHREISFSPMIPHPLPLPTSTPPPTTLPPLPPRRTVPRPPTSSPPTRTPLPLADWTLLRYPPLCPLPTLLPRSLQRAGPLPNLMLAWRRSSPPALSPPFQPAPLSAPPTPRLPPPTSSPSIPLLPPPTLNLAFPPLNLFNPLFTFFSPHPLRNPSATAPCAITGLPDPHRGSPPLPTALFPRPLPHCSRAGRSTPLWLLLPPPAWAPEHPCPSPAPPTPLCTSLHPQPTRPHGNSLGNHGAPTAFGNDPGLLYIGLGDWVEYWTCALCDFTCGAALDSAMEHIQSDLHVNRVKASAHRPAAKEELGPWRALTLLQQKAPVAAFLRGRP